MSPAFSEEPLHQAEHLLELGTFPGTPADGETPESWEPAQRPCAALPGSSGTDNGFDVVWA